MCWCNQSKGTSMSTRKFGTYATREEFLENEIRTLNYHIQSMIDTMKVMSMNRQDMSDELERMKQEIKSAVLAEREACAELVWPKLKVWSEEEQTAMGLAFNKAQEKHGWYETLMAVGASVLKMKAEAIRARGQA